MHIIKHHNQKAYMFLSNEGGFVRAQVVLIKQQHGKTEQTSYSQNISAEQARYLSFHKSELAEQGIYINDNCTYEFPILALNGVIGARIISPVESAIASPYISVLDSAVLFSTQKTRGPNN